jgi:hypothetical protein
LHHLDDITGLQLVVGMAVARNDVSIAFDGHPAPREAQMLDEMDKRDAIREAHLLPIQPDLHARIPRLPTRKCNPEAPGKSGFLYKEGRGE